MQKLSIKKSNLIKGLVIIIVGVFFGIIVFPQAYKAVTKHDVPSQLDIPFKLGLDLQGGTHLVYQADMSQIDSSEQANAMEGVRDVIERRVNAFGVAEPIVQVNKTKGKWRLIVELAGVMDVNEAINLIGQTPLLEFKEVNTGSVRDLTEEEQKQLDEENKKYLDIANGYLERIKNDTSEFDAIGKSIAEPEITIDPENTGEIDVSGILSKQNESFENLGFISEKSFVSDIYEKVKNVEKGTIFNEVIDTVEGYNIVKVDDKRDTESEVNAKHILICYQGASQCTNERSKEEAESKIKELKAKVNLDNFDELAKENSDEPGADTRAGDLGWFRKGQMVKPFEDAVFAMEKNTISDIVETEFGYHIIKKIDEKTVPEVAVTRILVAKKSAQDILPPQEQWKNTEVSGKHLKRAVVDFDQTTGQPLINLEFNDEGKDLFAAVTERNIGKPLGIFLDGGSIIDTDEDGVITDADIYAPTVNGAITAGNAQIIGLTDLTTANQLTKRLNSGALPVPINLINQQTVGASLGAESVAASIQAGIWGILIVMLFMLLYYRLPGITAILSLSVYALIILTIFKVLPVTLTLSGIAGFILSLGMAVDANILIFERIKEELKVGKPLYSAINDGFKRAWTSIRDGNISTLITCIILGWFGTSIIKGFAITLGIGVLVSMFSAIIITKIFIYALSPKQLDRYKSLFLGGKK